MSNSNNNKQLKQIWRKIGIIYPQGKFDFNAKNYAAVPIIGKIEEDIATIIYSSRNENNKSNLCDIQVNLKTFLPITSPRTTILEPGEVGTFDEDGVMASDIFEVNNTKYITYIGWNRGVSVPFRNAIGLAKYENDVFTKMFEGPILDRSIHDPTFVASNCVIKIAGEFIMYYLSCLKWELINGKLIHHYNIKIARSANGFNWTPSGDIAINFKNKNEYAISVPRVIFENNIYKMWYSFRGSLTTKTYRVGYAESFDGFNWVRKDEMVELETSNSGWDSEMICYPYIFNHKNNKYMLYNGNGYGKTGFGIAILEK